MVAVSAPGKLILMGEHGAVYGLPALTAALGLRVRAELADGGEEGVEMDLPNLGLHLRSSWREIGERAALTRARWQSYRDGAPFERDDDPAGVVRSALGEAATGSAPESLPPLRLRVRSELPVGAGFGSSAAVAVSVIAGFLAWRGGGMDLGHVGRLAFEVERRQHGRPSGIDHGTVLRGGVQWAAPDAGGDLRLRPVAARPELLRAFRIYDSGSPIESTGTVVAAVADHRRNDPDGFADLLARMGAAVADLRVALESGDDGGVAASVREFERCLEEIGVVPEPIQRAVRRLERAGGAAKISGAGALSGDAAGCLLVYQSPASAPEPPGWRRIDCAMGGPGLRLEAA
ncbi:MAG: mevalonate kinase [Thermoanaerobaculia bacterium]